MRRERRRSVWITVFVVAVACQHVDELDEADDQVDDGDAGTDSDTETDDTGTDSDSDADSESEGCTDLDQPDLVLEADGVPGPSGVLRFTDIALTKSPSSPFDTALFGEVETSTEAVDPVLVLFDVGPALDGPAEVEVAPYEGGDFAIRRALSVVWGYAPSSGWHFVTLQCGLDDCSLAGIAAEWEPGDGITTIVDYLTLGEPRGLGRLDAEIWVFGEGLWANQWDWTTWYSPVDPETGSHFNAMAAIPLADAYGAAVGDAGRILETGPEDWLDHPPVTPNDLLAVAMREIDVFTGEFAAGGRGGVIVDRDPDSDELRVFEAMDSDVTALAWIDPLTPILVGGTAAGELFTVTYTGGAPTVVVCDELGDEVVALEVVEHAGCDHLLVLVPSALYQVPLPCGD